MQENHYDPFGLNLVGIEFASAYDSQFQYNGKEKQEDFGLNWSTMAPACTMRNSDAGT
jgi:hypothetical protein